jgi:putative oxidoreductase
MKPEYNPLFSMTGRVLLALLFLPAGLSKLMNFHGTIQFVGSTGRAFPELYVVAAIAIELIAGALLLIGLRTKVAAAFLALFTFVASMLFHPFWAVPADQQFVQQLLFFKNIAIVGALMMVASLGGGAWSMDARLELRSQRV